MRLRTIPLDTYAQNVLPVTASLWAGARDLHTYVKQTSALARSTYGRRNYRTVGLFEGPRWLASCKRYERTIIVERTRLRAIGFGAVFTPALLRGRGYATTMLALLMDEAKARGFDAAYLFSDIRPAFYVALGFKECPSHAFRMPSDALPSERIRCRRIEASDWHDIAGCFRSLQNLERWKFERTAAVWKWIRMRIEQRAQDRTAQILTLAVTVRKRVVAYVIGQRQPGKDVFALDEYGWNGNAGSAAIGPLLRNAAGDLRRIAGWLPPSSALAPLKKIKKRRRTDAILMVAPFSAGGRRLAQLAAEGSSRDSVWSTDHI